MADWTPAQQEAILALLRATRDDLYAWCYTNPPGQPQDQRPLLRLHEYARELLDDLGDE